MEEVKPSDIKPNPSNPRIIRDDKFAKLVKSLKDFPEMANVRPVVVNMDGVILGGNMRYRAMIEAGWKKIPIERVDWPEDKQREFVIKDNVSGGEWDWDVLANEWDAGQLDEWGVDVPQTFADANEEIDVDGLDSEMCIKLNYSEDDYWKVKEALSKIAATPEAAVYQLLKL
jgi:ParB-like chromosome segregation protein Spo0J